ncbi:hypothetical protein CYY_009698, partial [Polysphondylium violaceum]
MMIKKLLYLFCFSILFLAVLKAQELNYTLLSPAESLDKYGSAEYDGVFRCQYTFNIAITQDNQAGAIRIVSVSGSNIYSMISENESTLVFNIQVFSVEVGSGTIDVEVDNLIGSTIFNIPYICQAPPTQLDVEFLNDTLYDSFQSTLYGPVAVFRVNNFIKEGPELTVTFASQSMFLASCELISFNVYKVMFGYYPGATWADITNDLVVNVEHPNNPITNPFTLKFNYMSGNLITPTNFKIFPVSQSNENTYYRIFPYFEFTATHDAPFLIIFNSDAIPRRLSPVMGNRTDGVFLSIMYPGVGLKTIGLFINNQGGVTSNQLSYTSNIPAPSYSHTIITGSFVDGIMISILNTNQPFREFQIKPYVLASSYISSITTPTLYPYAYSSGNAIQYQRSDEYFISPFAHGVYGFHYFNYMQEITLPSSNIDDTPPNIVSVSYVTFGNIRIYTVHITDDKSGFQKLIPYGNYTSLTSGTLLDGVYEFQVDLSKQVVVAPKLAVCDFVLNCRDVFISSFQTSDGGNFTNNYEFKSIGDINRVYWKYNNIDVSNDNVNNTLYICSSIRNLKPHIQRESELLKLSGLSYASFMPAKIGIYMGSCYEFDYVIYKNTMTGMAKYIFWMTDKFIESSLLETYFGEESKLKIKSINGDELGPLITNVQLSPGNSITIQLVDTSIEWLITIEDKFNGFKKGKITIAGDVGLVKYNFELTTLDLISGDEKYGVYKLVVPILYKCKSQKYFIQYVELEDNMGYQTIYIQDGKYDGNVPDSMIHILHDVDTLSSIRTQCMWAQTDTEPPQLSSFTFSPNTIDSTFSGLFFDNTPRLVTFNFVVTDNEGVLNSSIPIIYLQDQSLDIIQQTSQVIDYSGTSASYQCKFNIPYGFGFPNGIKVSVFGMVDLQSNIRGYSISQLFDAGFENTINVSPILNESISILSVTPLVPDYSQFFITGRNIKNTDRLIFQKDDYSIVKIGGPNQNTETIAFFSTSPSEIGNLYLTLKRGNSEEFSNTVLVFVNAGSSSSSSTSSTNPGSSSDSSTSNPSSSSSSTNPGSTISSSENSENSGLSSSDQFLPPTNPPQECLNNCGGINNGECKQNGCVCKSPWVGLDCSSQVIVIDPSIDPTLPQTNFTIPGTNGNNHDFYAIISIVSLNELNNDGQVVYTYPFTKWIVSNNQNSKYSKYTSKSYLYSSTITNKYDESKTTIDVSIDYFNQGANITFANQVLEMNPYSLKYSVNISQYSFSSNFNTLQLVLSASLESRENSKGECFSTQIGSTVGSESEFIKMQVDNHSLYGRFIKRGIVDGRIRHITNTPLSQEFIR